MKAWSALGLAGTVCWCIGGAGLAQWPGITLRVMILTEGARCR